MIKSDVVIIGAGPAGMLAALQLKRYGLEPLVFEARRLGGLLWNANLVENYPGFPGGIPGPELVERFSEQFTSLGLAAQFERIAHLDHRADGFVVATPESEILAQIVVIATGTRPRTFPESLIAEEAAERVLYEVADLPVFKDGHVAIVGAGDAAFDYALNLARHHQVTILNHGTEIKALPLLVARSRKNPNIHYYEHTTVLRVQAADHHLVLELSNPQGQREELRVDHLIGALGREALLPELGVGIKGQMTSLHEAGCLHLAGDVHNGHYRQTAIAVGDGLKAAMKIYAFLKEN